MESIIVISDLHISRDLFVEIDYFGFEFDEGFVVGYGLDYQEEFRTLPEIYTITVIEKGDE